MSVIRSTEIIYAYITSMQTSTTPEVIAVLCAGNPQIKKVNGNDEVDLGLNTDKSGYLGGAVRFNAAVKLCDQAKTLILVGGSIEKVKAMRQYLVSRGCDASKLILVESDPDTNGNVHAIRKLINSQEGPFGGVWPERLGILTNFYHQHRAMRFAADILNPKVTLVPLVAEAFTDADYWNEKEEFYKRMTCEINGLRQWEAGDYRDQTKPHDQWKCNIVS